MLFNCKVRQFKRLKSLLNRREVRGPDHWSCDAGRVSRCVTFTTDSDNFSRPLIPKSSVRIGNGMVMPLLSKVSLTVIINSLCASRKSLLVAIVYPNHQTEVDRAVAKCVVEKF
jgi:hypothetical protein